MLTRYGPCYFMVFAVLLAVLPQAVFASEPKKSSLPDYKLSVEFDLKNALLRGKALITVPPSSELVVAPGELRVLSVRLNGQAVEHGQQAKEIRISGSGSLEISYEGIFRGEDRGSLENAGVVSEGLVSEKGISLTGNWYPMINGLAHYELKALLPKDFAAISEAEEITVSETASGREYSFRFPHPLTGIDFVAGNYRITRETLDGIDIYTYFFPEDSGLADEYLEYTKKYLAMYRELLAPYPYRRFSVVENMLPTGYSMPTFTLLGQDVVRLPFIVKTSLGHEITHQWFGNYVYADFSKGNWLEAITTYLSDHLYEEQKGKGWEYRKKVMTDYENYVNSENEFPLREFMSRTGFASMAIGYGKGAMVFHMLRNLVGEETFYRSLRDLIERNSFRQASWTDIRESFEKQSGKTLGWFFDEWVDRKGIPGLKVNGARELVLKGVPTVSFELQQEGEAYRLLLPVRITAGHGIRKDLQVEKERQYFDLEADESPVDLIIDDNYDIMRHLSRSEYPPVVSGLLGDKKSLVVYPEKEREKYSALIDLFRQEGFGVKAEPELRDEEIRESSLLVLDFESPVLKRLFGGVGSPGPGFVFVVKKNPLNMEKVVAYANGESKEEVSLAARKIFHYGNYSVLRFKEGRNVSKETAETDRGMVSRLREPVAGVAPKNALGLPEIIDAVSGKPVVFVGERHTNYEDHKVELDVAMRLQSKGKKFAIGMEMFQRPFQKAIDEYLAGRIGEREFLKKSEYFKRWRFDYNYYREILEYARAKGIPVVALNLKAEIIDKVAKGGLDALSPDEKKEIPLDMDMADSSYRQRLEEIFESHPHGAGFANFYQSQILWDETMAHSVADFLKVNPDYQMVVLAGAQHVMYDSGIPGRVKRITGKEYATLINGEFDTGIGNYVLFPKPLDLPLTPKLGVIIKEKDGRVVIEDFAPDSVALQAGLRKGDALLSIGDWKIDTVEDARIALFDKKKGEEVTVKAVRKRFLLGEKEMEFKLTL